MRKNKGFKIKRIGGYLHKVTTLKDSKGNILEHIMTYHGASSRGFFIH